ncbi:MULTISPECIES: hypothetical protein [Helcococcus]|uniref:Uncharacterized protein n=1 Tax=Helcococcus bovis TaxID=3153252 RepID=A0ABW9F704_9FIRM
MKKNIKKLISVVFACGLIFSSINGVYAYGKIPPYKRGMVYQALPYTEHSRNYVGEEMWKVTKLNGVTYSGWLKYETSREGWYIYKGLLDMTADPYYIGAH